MRDFSYTKLFQVLVSCWYTERFELYRKKMLLKHHNLLSCVVVGNSWDNLYLTASKRSTQSLQLSHMLIRSPYRQIASQKCDLNFHVTLQTYVCLYEASILIRVSPIADLEDCRGAVHGFVWWVIRWSVCIWEGTLDLWWWRRIFQTTVCGLRFGKASVRSQRHERQV